VLRTDGDAAIDVERRTYREQALAAGVLCVDELIDAVQALAAVREYEAFRARLSAEARGVAGPAEPDRETRRPQ